MKNPIRNPLRSTRSGARMRAEQEQPTRRLRGLFVLVSLPIIAIGLRLGYLQAFRGPGMVDVTVAVATRTEPMPCISGRILAADGHVLAEDVVEYSLKVHYRWLETPPDPTWLKRQAYARLDRRQRRDAERVEREMGAILREREELWERIADVTGRDAGEIEESRRKVQERIERIVGRVEQRREEARQERLAQAAQTANDAWTAEGLLDRFKASLTTVPERHDRSPIVVKEEREYHVVVEGLPHAAAAGVLAHPRLFAGVTVARTSRRRYPLGDVAPHLIGNRTRLRDDVLGELEQDFPEGNPLDYRMGDLAGSTGIERTYDRHLRGVPGILQQTLDGQGEIAQERVLRESRPGRDVVLTLSLPLQEHVESVLAGVIGSGGEEDDAPPGAAIVALDVHTGAVLAMASAPRFDLNVLANNDAAGWEAIMADPRNPMMSRATRMTVAPGSVFKAVTTIALLEEGVVAPEEEFFCQGYLDSPERHRCYTYRHYGYGHGNIQLADAICRSCNVYFFAHGRKLGPERLYDWATRLGFGVPTGIDLPGERRGNVPSPFAKEQGGGAPWYPGDTLGLAIGQSRLTVTPVQVARLMAAIANGGYLVTPHVVQSFGRSSDGPEDLSADADSHPQFKLPIADETLAIVRDGLEKVVSNPRGTGYKRVRLDSVRIAGKTGTAEVGGTRGDHAWFAGYVPADAPRIAFAVVLEHGGSGGVAAGPVAKQFVEGLVELGLVGDEWLTLR